MITSTPLVHRTRRFESFVSRRSRVLSALAAATVACGGGASSDGTTVTPTPSVASISLSQTSASLFLTAALQLGATPRDASGNAMSGQTITWTSSSPSIASVTPAGLVTAIGSGTATITAAAGSQSASATITSVAIGVAIDSGVQLFHAHQADAMEMTEVPDMHTAILKQTDGSYRVWISGRFKNDSIEGATALVTTRDFLTYSPVGSTTVAQPVLIPSCRYPFAVSCGNNFDADYAGADWVYPASDGTDLLMLYHAQTKYYGGTTAPDQTNDPSWSVVGLARSSDQGVTWTGRTSVVSGTDAKPTTRPGNGIYGAVEPGAIAANGYVYVYYSYFPLSGPPGIQAARAPLSGDGAPGTWIKYNNGFSSSPGLGGVGTTVVQTGANCTRPAQPWPTFSAYLNAYALIFICKEGWFFSLSTDLVTWTQPQQFLTSTAGEFNGPTEENVILVTPGNVMQVIGQTGYVLYAYTPDWKGGTTHELWMRNFRFSRTP